MIVRMLAPFAALATLAAGPVDKMATFDGYALGMTVAQAEGVSPNRKAFDCGRLMTSRCIVYERRLGTLVGVVTIEFSLDDRRIDRIEIAPRGVGQGGASCETAWHGLVDFLSETFGTPQSREGNTVRWRMDAVAVTATVLQQQGEFCDVAAALTSIGPS